MPSNYTPNYQLNQWEPGDKVLRTEFNADNAKVDAALRSVSIRVDGKADQSALDAEVSARTAAVSAVQSALLGKVNCKIQTFSYTGTGGTTHTRTFDSRPAFFLIIGPESIIFGGWSLSTAYCVYSMDGRSGNGSVRLSWSSNKLTITGDERAVANRSGYTYMAVAFYKA